MFSSTKNQSAAQNFDNIFGRCALFNVVLIRYCGTLIFFIGIVSTILSIGVFTRKSLRQKSCCFYFLILAISDSVHLTTMIIERLPHSFQVDLIVLHSVVCKSVIFLIYFSNHFSNWILTCASIDRFVLIFCPTRSRKFCQIEKAKWLVLTIFLVLFVSDSHFLYGYDRLVHEDQQNSSGPAFDCNIAPEKHFYLKFSHVFDSYIESFLFVLIPFIVMTISSVLIIYQIVVTRRAVSKPRPKNSSKNADRQVQLREKDIQLCCMLIGTSLAFLVFCLPAEINDLFDLTDHDYSCFHWKRKNIFILLQQIYYAGHFYIFTLTSQLFRKNLVEFLSESICFNRFGRSSVTENRINQTKRVRDEQNDLIERAQPHQNQLEIEINQKHGK